MAALPPAPSARGGGSGARPPSPASSDSESGDEGDLLDLVEVISVGSSDEDEAPAVVPLEVLVKCEAAADERSPVVIKSELPAVAPHDAGFLVDLCSDESDDEEQRNDEHSRQRGVSTRALTGGFVYEIATDPGDESDGAGADGSSGRSIVIRFKRRKTGHNSAASSSAGVFFGGGGAEEVAAAAAALSSDSDTEAYVTDSYDDSEDSDVDSSDKNDTDDDTGDSADGADGRRSGSSSSSSHALTRQQVDAIILRDVQQLEAQKPWRFVYRCLEVPFHVDRSTDAFDLLFERWDAFWKLFGRAVWERYFWAPLPAGTLEYHRRKHRQWRAARTFRALAAELCEKLGRGFLRQVARQAHDGWWYRSPPLLLRELFNLDRRKYGMYMTLFRERFPRGSNFERSLDAAWCLDAVALAAASSSCSAHLDLAQKAWQDVVRSDDDDDDDCDSADGGWVESE
ncbi:hypothetical protein PybrP1_000772 [[Pythium] brassicae (nom. inval.)]|nr:hypothetical protein PybrP1_000772 [[Pythium] brassicae (nom. inval.)]